MDRRINYKKCSTLLSTALITMLVILTTTITAFADGDGRPAGTVTTDPYGGGAHWSGWIGVRVFPVEITEEAGAGEAPYYTDYKARYSARASALYYAIPPAVGQSVPTGVWGYESIIDGTAQMRALDHQYRTLNSASSNVFVKWLSDGAIIDTVGSELSQAFFPSIAESEENRTKWWDGYFQEWEKTYNRVDNTGSEKERYLQLISENKLGIVVELLHGFWYPLVGGDVHMCIATSDYLVFHNQATSQVTGVSPLKEQEYIRVANPAGDGRSLGCYGNNPPSGQSPCTNAYCVNFQHMRYSLGIPVGINDQRLIPFPRNNPSYEAIARVTYSGWSFFQAGMPSKPKIKVIETHVYKVDGIEVDREVVYNESYADKPKFLAASSPKGANRKTSETKSKHGQTYEFVEYSYETMKRDPITDNDIAPAIDSGSSSTPEIKINTGVIDPNGTYTVYVVADL